MMQNGDATLENKFRRMLYNHIISYPGVSFNTLKNIYELTESGLRYHLNYLEKNNKISSSVERGIRCYFPHPTSVMIPKNAKNVLESQKLPPHQELILTTIMRYPGISQKELIKRTGIKQFKLSRDIRTLSRLNLIKNTKRQNTSCYEYIPNIEMKFQIIKGFIVKYIKAEIDEETLIRLIKRLG
jgi:predicted transcriptional regulator